MENRYYIWLTALLMSCLPGCFYSDSDMYYVEPIPDDPPELTVSTNLDSLYNPPVNDSLEVEYRVDIRHGELYYVYAEIARAMVFESDSVYGSFWITPFMADSAGIDTLHMEFYYSSNTNSLADKLGYEALVKYLDFALDFNTGGRR
jgi:hypothetical protein